MRRLSWFRLMGAAAIVEAAALLVAGAALGDAESIVFGAIVSATSAWLLWRRSLIPVLLRSLVFLDVLFFMATAAIANLSTLEGFGPTVLPLGLAVTSAVGLVATAGYLASRRGERAGGRAAGLVAIIAVLLTATGAGVTAAGSADAQRSSAGDLALNVHSAKFSSTDLRAAAGEVSIHVTNDDLFWHTLTIDSLGVDVRVPVKGHRRVTFRASPGVYEFHCAVPGHAASGMKGTLTVR